MSTRDTTQRRPHLPSIDLRKVNWPRVGVAAAGLGLLGYLVAPRFGAVAESVGDLIHGPTPIASTSNLKTRMTYAQNMKQGMEITSGDKSSTVREIGEGYESFLDTKLDLSGFNTETLVSVKPSPSIRLTGNTLDQPGDDALKGRISSACKAAGTTYNGYGTSNNAWEIAGVDKYRTFQITTKDNTNPQHPESTTLIAVPASNTDLVDSLDGVATGKLSAKNCVLSGFTGKIDFPERMAANIEKNLDTEIVGNADFSGLQRGKPVVVIESGNIRYTFNVTNIQVQDAATYLKEHSSNGK